MEKSKDTITVYFDGQCPLCSLEINHLKKADKGQGINFEDIQAEDFSKRNPNLSIKELDARLHVKDSNGNWIKGLDANYLLWQTVGLGKWAAPLNWKWLRPIANPIYHWFAKHRHTITKILFRQKYSSLRNRQNKHE